MGDELRASPARCWTRLEAVFTQFLTHKSTHDVKMSYSQDSVINSFLMPEIQKCSKQGCQHRRHLTLV